MAVCAIWTLRITGTPFSLPTGRTFVTWVLTRTSRFLRLIAAARYEAADDTRVPLETYNINDEHGKNRALLDTDRHLRPTLPESRECGNTNQEGEDTPSPMGLPELASRLKGNWSGSSAVELIMGVSVSTGNPGKLIGRIPAKQSEEFYGNRAVVAARGKNTYRHRADSGRTSRWCYGRLRVE